MARPDQVPPAHAASASGPTRPAAEGPPGNAPRVARRLRVLFINKYYFPDDAATAQLLTDLAEFLAARGVEVTVIAGRRGYRGPRARLRRRETIRRVRIVRVASTGFGRASLAGRIADYLSFWLSALWGAMRLPRQDVVVAMTSPPLIHWLGALVKHVRGGRFVVWTMDVYPDVAVALGVLRERSPLVRAIRFINRSVLRSADAVIALGDAMARRLEAAGAGAGTLHVVHNWADGEAIRPVAPEENPFRHEHGLDGRFVVEYSGNIGLGHTFAAVLEAAQALRAEPDVVFLFVGSGPGEDQIAERARRDGLDNVLRLPYQPRERLRWTLSAGDVHLVTLKEGLAGMLVPSKLYGIMAAGRPVIYVGDPASDTAEIIRRAGCGFVLAEDDAAGLIESIRRLRADAALRGRLGRAGRDWFERCFAREDACVRIERILRAVADPMGADGGPR